MHKIIPYGRHSIEEEDIEAVVRVLKSDWLTCGPLIEQFEEKLCDIVKAQHTVACSNGTTALHLALLALSIEPGDTVLVPAVTFLASANAVRYVGADIIFMDVDPYTGLMTAETLESAVKNNPNKSFKAIINVHLAGQCEDLEKIHQIAKKYNLLIIEDAAHALGTVYKDSKTQECLIGANAYADLTTFSFHPVKTIATGEGGAVTTNNSEIANKIRLLRSHGMIRDSLRWQERKEGFGGNDYSNPWYYEMHELGYNYRISDINCALGLSQLNKLENFKAKRSQMVSFYDHAFENNDIFKPLSKLERSDTLWHLYILLIDFEKLGRSRTEVMIKLKEKGIGSQVHYIPLYKQPYYKKLYNLPTLPGAENYYSRCLSLPLYPGLQEDEQKYIVEEILKL